MKLATDYSPNFWTVKTQCLVLLSLASLSNAVRPLETLNCSLYCRYRYFEKLIISKINDAFCLNIELN